MFKYQKYNPLKTYDVILNSGLDCKNKQPFSPRTLTDISLIINYQDLLPRILHLEPTAKKNENNFYF